MFLSRIERISHRHIAVFLIFCFSCSIDLDQPNNPYKPTYTFPDEFSGDSDHMEDYIRKTASQNIEKDNRK